MPNNSARHSRAREDCRAKIMPDNSVCRHASRSPTPPVRYASWCDIYSTSGSSADTRAAVMGLRIGCGSMTSTGAVSMSYTSPVAPQARQ